MTRLNTLQKILPLAIFALPLLIIVFLSYKLADGHFVYTLDDPYIHLAIAENIFHGHYGVNSGEFSSASSSILWPFLLALFYPAGSYFEFIPLVINTLCTIGSGLILLQIFNFTDTFKRTFIALLIALSFNLYGLAYTGMEHSLQVMLTLWVLKKLIRNEYDTTFFILLIILPLIRYECLAISMPVLLVSFLKGFRKPSILTFLIIGTCIGAFSLYLFLNQQNILPNSVVSKTFMYTKAGLFFVIRGNLSVCGIFLLPAAYLLFQEDKERRTWGLLLFLATALFVVLGRTSGFIRYEVFYQIAVNTGIIYFVIKNQPKLIKILVLLPIVNAYMLSYNFLTPRASSNIYRQHVQMGKISRLLNENVAINDLGYVALSSPKYVLDFWGIGSKKALEYQIQNHGTNHYLWMDSIMQYYNVNYAMIYETWFTKIPANWIKVADLTLDEKNRTVGGNTISFFATSSQYAGHLRAVIQRYQKEGVPSRTSLSIY